MADKNKSTIIIVIVLILLIVGGAFLFTTLNDNTLEDDVTVTQNNDNDTGEFDDLMTNDTTATTNANIGEAGTVTDIDVPEILGVRAIGNPDAPVQVREYFSLTCNHCAAFHESTFKQLKSKYIDTGKVYFIFEEMPLNGPALYGSMIARCLPEARYPEFVSMLLKTQADWAFGGDFKASLQKSAALAGMNEDEFNACFENEELRTAIAENIDASAQAWNITSTPSFVFNNGERILRGSQDIGAFDAIYALLTDENIVSTQTTDQTPKRPVTTPISKVEDFEPNGDIVEPEIANPVLLVQ